MKRQDENDQNLSNLAKRNQDDVLDYDEDEMMKFVMKRSRAEASL